jgi:hypothetical protein
MSGTDESSATKKADQYIEQLKSKFDPNGFGDVCYTPVIGYWSMGLMRAAVINGEFYLFVPSP